MDKIGHTPLSYVVGRKIKEAIPTIEILLEYGANIEFKVENFTIREVMMMFDEDELMIIDWYNR